MRRFPSIEDRESLLYAARMLLRSPDPEKLLERWQSTELITFTSNSMRLVERYRTLLEQHLPQNPCFRAEQISDKVVSELYGWPTMESMGYSHAPADDE